MSPARRKYACSECTARPSNTVRCAADSACPSTWPPNTYFVPMSRLCPRNRFSSSRSSSSSSISSLTIDPFIHASRQRDALSPMPSFPRKRESVMVQTDSRLRGNDVGSGSANPPQPGRGQYARPRKHRPRIELARDLERRIVARCDAPGVEILVPRDRREVRQLVAQSRDERDERVDLRVGVGLAHRLVARVVPV